MRPALLRHAMRATRHFLAAIFICVSVAVAAEPAMVIDARGPSAGLFPRGKMLESAFSATLLPNDRLIVVDRKGTRVFSGPGPVAIDRETGAPSRWDDIRTMVVRSSDHVKRRTRMNAGAVRGGGRPAGAATDAPDISREGLWTLEWPDANGSYCFDSSVGLIVRRAPAAGTIPYPAESFDITGNDLTVLSVSVPEGHPLFLWPENEMPKKGQQGSYSITSSDHRAEVTLVSIPVRDLDPLQLAQLLDQRKCNFALSMFADKADQIEAGN